MKKIAGILFIFTIVVLVGVCAFVNYDVEKKHIGYAIINDGKITGFIDAEGNKTDLDY